MAKEQSVIIDNLLQDTYEFLNETLASEKLSKAARAKCNRLSTNIHVYRTTHPQQQNQSTVDQSDGNSISIVVPIDTSRLQLSTGMYEAPVTVDECIYNDVGGEDDVYDDIGHRLTECDIYDDAGSKAPKDALKKNEAIYDDMQGKAVAQESIYDDAICQTKTPKFADGKPKAQPIFNDDRLVKSTEPRSPDKEVSHIYKGYLKRRSCKHLIAAWCRCLVVLYKDSLLIHSNTLGKNAKEIDLTKGFQIKQLCSTGLSAPKKKVETFFLFIEGKPIYEFCANTLDETEQWIQAFCSLQPETKEQHDSHHYYVLPNAFKPTTTANNNTKHEVVMVPPEELYIDAANGEAEELYDCIPGEEVALMMTQGKSEEAGFNEDDITNAQNYDQEEIYENLPSPARSSTPYSYSEDESPTSPAAAAPTFQNQLSQRLATLNRVRTAKPDPNVNSNREETDPDYGSLCSDVEVEAVNPGLPRSEMKTAVPNHPKPKPKPPVRETKLVTPFSSTLKSVNMQQSAASQDESNVYVIRLAYVSQNQFEVSVKAGETVRVLKKTGPYWMVKTSNNTKGLIPKEYLFKRFL